MKTQSTTITPIAISEHYITPSFLQIRLPNGKIKCYIPPKDCYDLNERKEIGIFHYFTEVIAFFMKHMDQLYQNTPKMLKTEDNRLELEKAQRDRRLKKEQDKISKSITLTIK